MKRVNEEGVDHARLTIKGKRTKRQRISSPPVATGELSETRGDVIGNANAVFDHIEGDMKGDDEDMANCLMLLAQGRRKNCDHQTANMGFFSNKKPLTDSSGFLGLGLGLDEVYRCKTCEKSFPSFQALGGHRASHKKSKNGEEKKSAFAVGENRELDEATTLGSFLSLQVISNSSKKSEKIHECSICKAEFSSGQALGGHMRKHRNVVVNPNSNAIANTTTLNNVGLDLNLPAPDDERCDQKPKLAFASKDQILIFTAISNSLVDCHN